MANSNNNGTTLFTTEKKKAHAWININLPVKSKDPSSTSFKKLGGIPLDLDNALHALVIDALKELSPEDQAKTLQTLLSKSKIDFVIPDTSGNDSFQLDI